MRFELVESIARLSPDFISFSSFSALKAGAAIKQERKEDAAYLPAASGLHHLTNAV